MNLDPNWYVRVDEDAFEEDFEEEPMNTQQKITQILRYQLSSYKEEQLLERRRSQILELVKEELEDLNFRLKHLTGDYSGLPFEAGIETATALIQDRIKELAEEKD